MWFVYIIYSRSLKHGRILTWRNLKHGRVSNIGNVQMVEFHGMEGVEIINTRILLEHVVSIIYTRSLKHGRIQTWRNLKHGRVSNVGDFQIIEFHGMEGFPTWGSFQHAHECFFGLRRLVSLGGLKGKEQPETSAFCWRRGWM